MTAGTITTTPIMTATDSVTHRVRLSFGRAAPVVVVGFVLLVVSGCSPSGITVTETSTVTSLPAPVVTTTTGGEEAASQTAEVDDLDGREVLARALARYEDGYRFDSVAGVEGSQAVRITGVIVGESAQMSVVSGDATVGYVITPDASWIQVGGGVWREVRLSGPIERPLEGLASPDSITVVSSNESGITAVAVYDGAVFDVEGNIEMFLWFGEGRLVNASYSSGGASVSTAFDLLDGATIEVPEASS